MSEVSKIIQKKAEIRSNVHIVGDYYKLSLHVPEIVRFVQPGQFVMLRISDDYRPLLRRPFSIHSVGDRRLRYRDRIEILYEVIGSGTKILSEKKSGEYLDVLGPLGNGFSILDSRFSILVAGGIGVAPLFFLAQRLTKTNVLVLIGVKTKKEILCKKEFENLDLNVKISTDDGSAGLKGKVTELLRSILRINESTNQRINEQIIYACGPKPMLKEISIIAKQYNIPAQICLDEHMACGLGICLGCMVKTQKGYQAVCKDGPVFDSSILRW